MLRQLVGGTAAAPGPAVPANHSSAKIIMIYPIAMVDRSCGPTSLACPDDVPSTQR